MIKAEVILDNLIWNKRIEKPHFFFNKLLKNFPTKYQFKKKKVSLTILLSDNKTIKKLNKKFRKKNKYTDILSFPFSKKLLVLDNTYLGDIIISYDYINNQKILTNKELKEKVFKLFIHGFLHLLNYDHIKLKDFKKMDKEETNIYNFTSKKIEKFI
jgi:probable rRNA maturation factor